MDIVEFAEKICGVQLLEYQKVILRACEQKRKIYIIVHPSIGRTHFGQLLEAAKAVYEKEIKNEL